MRKFRGVGGISRLDTKLSVGLERAECGQFVDRVDPARPRGSSGSYTDSREISQRDPARPQNQPVREGYHRGIPLVRTSVCLLLLDRRMSRIQEGTHNNAREKHTHHHHLAVRLSWSGTWSQLSVPTTSMCWPFFRCFDHMSKHVETRQG